MAYHKYGCISLNYNNFSILIGNFIVKLLSIFLNMYTSKQDKYHQEYSG